MAVHAKVREIGLPRGLGDIEAEQMLRVFAATETDAGKRAEYAKAVQEIDTGRAQAREAATARITDMAKRLGCSADQLQATVGILAADVELFTWLTRRVNETRAHDRPLEHHE